MRTNRHEYNVVHNIVTLGCFKLVMTPPKLGSNAMNNLEVHRGFSQDAVRAKLRSDRYS